MGEIRVSDGADDARFVTGRLDGEIELSVRDGRPRLVVDGDGALSAADVEVVEGEVGATRRRLVSSPWWSLYVPTVLGVVFVLGASFELFEWLVPAHASTVETALAICFVLTAWVGTSVVVRDADELRAADASWQPIAWQYVAGGALVPTGYLLATAGTLPAGLDLLPVVVGAAVVGVATAAAVTGPLYLHRRERRVGLD